MRSHVWNVNPLWYGHFAIGGKAIACWEENDEEKKRKKRTEITINVCPHRQWNYFI